MFSTSSVIEHGTVRTGNAVLPRPVSSVTSSSIRTTTAAGTAAADPTAVVDERSCEVTDLQVLRPDLHVVVERVPTIALVLDATEDEVLGHELRRI